jgi:hypothetical protein
MERNMDDRYAAGLFDGEGYVRIARWEKPNSMHIRYQIFMGIGMCFYPVIKMLSDQYGGTINENRHDLRNPKNRIQFNWKLASQKAAAFLRRIEPYSVVKQDEINVALQLQEHIDNNPYIPTGKNHEYERKDRAQILEYREKLYKQITLLKKRSFPPLLNNGPMRQ